MSCKYHYNISPDALYHPAADKTPEDFFVQWSADELATTDMRCAELCRLAYGDQELVRYTLPRAGLKLVAWIGGENIVSRLRSWGTDGFVAVDAAGQVWLVFRGTEPGKMEDIIADLRIGAVPWWQGGQVHEGFNAAYHAIHDPLRDVLAKYTGKLIITGHSLGGAVATLAGADYRERSPQLITFGCPRVGNADFVKVLQGKVKAARYVDCCDVVTRVPPEKLDQNHLKDLLGDFLWTRNGLGWVESSIADLAATLAGQAEYSHFGDALYIDDTGTLQRAWPQTDITRNQQQARAAYPPKTLLQADATSSDAFFDDLFDVIKDRLSLDRVPFRDLADHAPLNYVSAYTGRL